MSRERETDREQHKTVAKGSHAITKILVRERARETESERESEHARERVSERANSSKWEPFNHRVLNY